MRKVFNLGIGMVAVVPPAAAHRALDVLRTAGHRAVVIGEVAARLRPGALRRLPDRARPESAGPRVGSRRMSELQPATASTAPLSSFDDFPVHQSAETIRHAATSDRNFYDRYYFNCHANDGEAFLIFGLGQYPNLAVQDAFACLVTATTHRVVRASRRARRPHGHLGGSPVGGGHPSPARSCASRVRPGTTPSGPTGSPSTWRGRGRSPRYEEPRQYPRMHGRAGVRHHAPGPDRPVVGHGSPRRPALRRHARAVVGDPGPQLGRPAGRRAGAPGHPHRGPDAGLLELRPRCSSTTTPSSTWSTSTRTATGSSRRRCGSGTIRDGRPSTSAVRSTTPCSPPAPGTSSRSTLRLPRCPRRRLRASRSNPLLDCWLLLGTGYGIEEDWRFGMYQGPQVVQGVDIDYERDADRLFGLVDQVGRFTQSGGVADGAVGHGLHEFFFVGHVHPLRPERLGPHRRRPVGVLQHGARRRGTGAVGPGRRGRR